MLKRTSTLIHSELHGDIATMEALAKALWLIHEVVKWGFFRLADKEGNDDSLSRKQKEIAGRCKFYSPFQDESSPGWKFFDPSENEGRDFLCAFDEAHRLAFHISPNRNNTSASRQAVLLEINYLKRGSKLPFCCVNFKVEADSFRYGTDKNFRGLWHKLAKQ